MIFQKISGDQQGEIAMSRPNFFCINQSCAKLIRIAKLKKIFCEKNGLKISTHCVVFAHMIARKK